MGAAKKAYNYAMPVVNPVAYLANAGFTEMAGMGPVSAATDIASALRGPRAANQKLPFLPDSTDAVLKELARMGIQRKLLQSSGRLGAFKGFDTNFRPVGR